ncbi:MAG: RNA polymerase sigma factor [Gammaproteobacteria bacterium]|nr:RNA polymerase sigma factor [Gammaproteobacteria bacterium]
MPDELTEQLPDLLPRLRRFAIGMSGSRDAGDELLQAACERALSRQHQWTPGTRLDSWMYRIIQTLWIDELRRIGRQGETMEAEILEYIPAGDGRHDAETLLTLDEALGALGQLPEDQRVILLLVSVEGYSYKEAAAALELPIGTVMSRLARARLRLTSLIDEGASRPAQLRGS